MPNGVCGACPHAIADHPSESGCFVCPCAVAYAQVFSEPEPEPAAETEPDEAESPVP